MKPETLESLLIDRALGELTPEAADLLAAWCAEHPEDAAAAPPIERTLRAARAATATPKLRTELPVPQWQRSLRRRRGSEWLRLAACMAAGVGLGWLARPSSRTSGTSVVAAVSPGAVETVESSVAPSRFWSVSARVEAAQRSAELPGSPGSRRGLLRPSLLKMPQLEAKP